MKKKNARAAHPTRNLQTVAAAASEAEDTPTAKTVAAVKDIANKIKLGEETVIRIAGESCKLAALIDTGSPVSFMRYKEFGEYGKARNIKIHKSNRKLNNLSGEPLEIIGVVQIVIIIEKILSFQ